MNEIIIGWWSAGITSAVACKIALEKYDNVVIYYIETGAAHEDNQRFKAECEKWYGKEIQTVTNTKGYKDPIDVVLKTGYVNGPEGARCTLELKKNVRYMLEEHYTADLFNDTICNNQIFGYEFDRKQVNRAIRFLQQYPTAKPLFPLIEKGLTKDNCAAILMNAGIKLPTMYGLGYSNNNCIGCVKGGAGYWNKIRKHFPLAFNRMAAAERAVGHTCIKNTFLDELNPRAGKRTKEIAPECGHFCEVELADIEDRRLEDILQGKTSIYDAA